MKDIDTQDRFIELRAQGWSYARIAEELHVAKATLVAWSVRFEHEIKNLRAIHLEALQEKHLASEEARLQMLGAQLKKIEEELAKRDFSSLPTWRLIQLASILRREIRNDNSVIKFAMPMNDIPEEVELEGVHEWKG